MRPAEGVDRRPAGGRSGGGPGVRRANRRADGRRADPPRKVAPLAVLHVGEVCTEKVATPASAIRSAMVWSKAWRMSVLAPWAEGRAGDAPSRGPDQQGGDPLPYPAWRKELHGPVVSSLI